MSFQLVSFRQLFRYGRVFGVFGKQGRFTGLLSYRGCPIGFAFVRVVHGLLVFLVANFSRFFRVARGGRFVDSVRRPRVLRDHRRANEVHVMYVGCRFVVHNFHRLQAIVVEGVHLRYLAGLPKQCARRPTRHGNNRYVLRIVATSGINVRLRLLSLIFPLGQGGQDADTRLTTSVGSLSSFRAVAGANGTLESDYRVLVILICRGGVLTVMARVLVRLAFDLSSPFGEPRTFRVHLTRVDSRAMVQFCGANRYLSFAQVIHSRLSSDRFVLKDRPRRDREGASVIVRIALYVGRFVSFLRR